MIFILSALGKIFLALPEKALDCLCCSIGWLICTFPSRRARIGRANIARCFPDMPESERRRILFESCRRMVEMALFVVTSPHMSDEDIKSRVKLSDYIVSELQKLAENPRPTVIMIPHFAMMETITMFPLVSPSKTPRTCVFYRPFNSPALEKWVKDSRMRFGIELLSRRNGFHCAVDFLRKNGCVAVLFDQNPRDHGVLSFFFERLCTTTDLPGILVEHQKADCVVLYARRTGFWRSIVDGERFDAHSIEDVTMAGNEWLEKKLKTDETARFDWLWLHKRWAFKSRNFLNSEIRKDMTGEWLASKGLEQAPRKFNILINMPDSLRDSLAILPQIAALRKSRRDSVVTLLVPPTNLGILDIFKVADRVSAVPSGIFRRIQYFWKIRRMYADIFINFRECILSDIESAIVFPSISYAINYGRRRFGADIVYTPDAASGAEHFAVVCGDFFAKNGMNVQLDYSPLNISSLSSGAFEKSGDIVVGVVSLPSHGEDWGLDNWSSFVKALDSNLERVRFKVFTSDEKSVFEMSKFAPDAEIECVFFDGSNLAEFAMEVSACELLVGMDSDMTYVANAVGVKVAALCGKNSNLIRNGMVYDVPKAEIQAPGSPRQDGGGVDKISPDVVVEVAMNLLSL